MILKNINGEPWTISFDTDEIQGGKGNSIQYQISNIDWVDYRDGLGDTLLSFNPNQSATITCSDGAGNWEDAIATVSEVDSISNRVNDLEEQLKGLSDKVVNATTDGIQKLIDAFTALGGSGCRAEEVSAALQKLSTALNGARTNDNPEISNKKEDLEKMNENMGQYMGIKICPTHQAAAWMNDLGIQVYDENYDILPVADILEILTTVWHRLTPNQKYKMAQQLAPEESMKFYNIMNGKRAAAAVPTEDLTAPVDDLTQPTVDPAQPQIPDPIISMPDIQFGTFDFEKWLNSNVLDSII